jgi:hypothetical protein
MGLTPLHLAAAGGHSDICTLLVGFLNFRFYLLASL